MSRKPPATIRRAGCSDGGRIERLRSLSDVVHAYVKSHREKIIRELRFYEIQRNLGHAVEKAAHSTLPSGKRHAHQHRIPKITLDRAFRALVAVIDDLASAATFDELHDAVARSIGGIHGIGNLTVYDVAHRIGAHLGLAPTRIYLHAGTKVGARALGLGGSTLAMSSLPDPFHDLTPAEIEDCLCIYKADIQMIAAVRNRRRVRSRIE